MKKIYILLLSILLTVWFSWNCTEEDNPLNNEENFNKKLEIKTEKSQYTMDEISAGSYVFIKAALINNSQDTLYTKLGDGFNSSLDQDDLSIAKYTDGYFEKNTSYDNWENLNLGILIEGSKITRILPLKKYNLTASAYLNPGIEGKFRLKVYYYKNNPRTKADSLKDISNIFYISNN